MVIMMINFKGKSMFLQVLKTHVRFISVAVVSLGIILLTGCDTPTISNDAVVNITNNWSTQTTDAYKGKRDSISFIDQQTGWYGTGKGDLYKTVDGGTTWFLVKSQPGTFVRAVAFIDEKHGYIGNVGTDYYPGVTDETPLYHTSDGGQTWMSVDLGDATIKGVCAIDILLAERIYQGNLSPTTVIHAAGRVGGPTGILRSVDNGKSWGVIDMSKHAGMILDVKFFTENTGLVFAATTSDARTAQGLILRTEDGGSTWTEVYAPDRPHELIWKASFPDDQNGFATVQSYDQDRATQLIVKTEDSGQTWQEMEMTQNEKARQFGIGFLDANHGWVGTMEGGFYTPDGGETFQAVPIAKAANKFQVLKHSDQSATVWAIGTEVQRLDIRTSEEIKAP